MKAAIHNRGFSLIELVSSLVVVGTISASVMPVMVSMDEAAKNAKIDGAIAALESGVRAARAQWIVSGSPEGASQVELEGESISLYGGWPLSHSIASVAGISCQNYGCFRIGSSVQYTASTEPKENEACFTYSMSAPATRYTMSQRSRWDATRQRCR